MRALFWQTHDLEIRGAGELLGDEQSGQIESIGFSYIHGYAETSRDALCVKAANRLSDQLIRAPPHTDDRLTHPPSLTGSLHQGCETCAPPLLWLYKRIAGARVRGEIRTAFKWKLIDRCAAYCPTPP